MRHYCTLFDQRYLPRALALYRSMQRHCGKFELWACCLDQEALHALQKLKLPGVIPVALEELEAGDAGLKAAKANRSTVEYYFTLSPHLPLYIFKRAPKIELLTYLDADLYFFHSPEKLFEELGARSVGLIAHRYAKALKGRERYGMYNVGWLNYRNDARGHQVLEWWRARCIEWCYDRLEANRYGDQKYLDEFQPRFEGVAVLEHQGGNVAPWNLSNAPVTWENEKVLISGQPLIFFHFQGFKRVRAWLFDPNLMVNKVRPTAVIRERILRPYVRELLDIERDLTELLPGAEILQTLRKLPPKSGFSEWLRFAKGLWRGQYVIVRKAER